VQLLTSNAQGCLSAAGLPQEAVNVLQEAQLWRYAATLTANTLSGSDRAITLERWASHIHQVSAMLCPHQSCAVEQLQHDAESVCVLANQW